MQPAMSCLGIRGCRVRHHNYGALQIQMHPDRCCAPTCTPCQATSSLCEPVLHALGPKVETINGHGDCTGGSINQSLCCSSDGCYVVVVVIVNDERDILEGVKDGADDVSNTRQGLNHKSARVDGKSLRAAYESSRQQFRLSLCTAQDGHEASTGALMQ